MEMEPAVPDLYEYRKGRIRIRNAFRILEENGLNVFRKTFIVKEIRQRLHAFAKHMK